MQILKFVLKSRRIEKATRQQGGLLFKGE